MWLFTRHGMFSVVAAKYERGTRAGQLDPRRMMVRARRRSDLDRLKREFPGTIGSAPVRETRDADYAFRIVVAREIWVALADLLADDVDYGNFKDAARAADPADRDYLDALHEIWAIMRRLQDGTAPAGYRLR